MTRKVEVFILGDSKGAQRAFRDLNKSAQDTESTLERTAKTAASAGDKLTKGVTLPLAALGVASVKAASDLEQSTGAIESVLGDAASIVTEFGDTAAESYGLAREEVNRLGAVVGAQLTGMGFEHRAAAETVVELEKRAADLAATFGGSTAQAIEAISALLRGERDPIERYGVSIKAVDVNARIAAMGLDTSTAAAKKNAEAVAGMDLLFESTADAAGQFAREADTLAGKQARAAAEAKNLAAEFGTALLPVAADVVGVVGDVAGAFGDLSPEMQETIVKLGLMAAAAGPILSVGGRLVTIFSGVAKSARELHTGLATMRAMAGQSTPSFGALAGAVGGVGLAIGAAVAIYANWKREQAEAKAHVDELTASLDVNTGAITDNTRAAVAAKLEQEGLLEVAKQLGLDLGLVTDAAMGNADAQAVVAGAAAAAQDAFANGREVTREYWLEAQRLSEAVAGESVALDEAAEQHARLAEAQRGGDVAAAELEGRFHDLRHAIDSGLDPALAHLALEHQAAAAAAGEQEGAQGNLEGQVDDTTGAVDEQTSALEAHAEQLLAQVDPVFAVTKAARDYKESQDAANEAIAKYGPESDQAVEASQGALEAFIKLQGASGELADGFTGKVSDGMREVMTAAGFTADQIRAVEKGFADTKTVTDAFTAGSPYEAIVKANTGTALEAISEVQRRLNALGATVRIDGAGAGVGVPGVRHEGGVIRRGDPGRAPGLKPNERMTVLEEGEEVLTAKDPRHVDNLTAHHLADIFEQPQMAAGDVVGDPYS